MGLTGLHPQHTCRQEGQGSRGGNNQRTNSKGIKNRVNNKLSVEENIRNLIKGFSELNNKDYNFNHKTQTTKGKSFTRKDKDKDGLCIKYSKLSVNILEANCRSINDNKKKQYHRDTGYKGG